jgi:hypothetical protein
MTVFSEEYFAQIMFWLKAGALSTVIYFAPSLTGRESLSLQEPEPCA